MAGPVRLRPSVAADELGAVPVLHEARTLLAMARELGGLGRTQAGNLKVLDQAPDLPAGLDEAWLFERDFLRRLVEFGVLERRGPDPSEYRPTPLMRSFLSFHL